MRENNENQMKKMQIDNQWGYSSGDLILYIYIMLTWSCGSASNQPVDHGHRNQRSPLTGMLSNGDEGRSEDFFVRRVSGK
jgi:hypothetical protein